MGEAYIEVEQVLGSRLGPTSYEYDDRDVILYALGIGAARDPLDPQELAFTYEGKGFKLLPTFAVTFPAGMTLSLASLAGLKFNPMMLLHGEHYLEVMQPLPTAAHVTSHGRISQVYDKGSGALIMVDVTSVDEAGETLAFNQSSLFIRGLGGFGGDSGPSTSRLNLPPEREPDVVHEEAIPANQALLYRLSGDRNPLHADPAMAAQGGYERPILHGLCTFGFAARAVIKHFADNDPHRFKSIKTRFARHFFPGETLITEMWAVDDGAVVFRCKVAERDEFVLTNARIELEGV